MFFNLDITPSGVLGSKSGGKIDVWGIQIEMVKSLEMYCSYRVREKKGGRERG